MSSDPGRILGLDLGDVRVGLALSDPLGITAQPAGHLDRKGSPSIVDRIGSLVNEREVTRIVVGYPLELSGEAGERAMESEAFAERLRKRIPGVSRRTWAATVLRAGAVEFGGRCNPRATPVGATPCQGSGAHPPEESPGAE